MKTIRIISMLVAMLFASTAVSARGPLLRYGVEWGYTPMAYEAHHLNYIAKEGFRVDDNDSGGKFASNASLLVDFGVNLTDNFSLGLYFGYTGISEDNRVLPLSMRMTWFPKGITSDGFLCYAEAGAGFHMPRLDVPGRPAAFLTGAGAGYHLALSRSMGLDFQIGLRESLDHALIPEPDGSGYVSGQNIRKNNAAYSALNITIGLTF